MEVMKNVELNLKDGKIVLEVDAAAMLVPSIDMLIAKVQSGEIDPIKGTDLDQITIIKVLESVKLAVVK